MVGKLVFDDLYLHVSAIENASEGSREAILAALRGAPDGANVVRVNVRTGELRLLEYENFDADPFPALRASWRQTADGRVIRLRSYNESLNPPILHRKELLVAEDYPKKDEWARFTAQAEALGLFDSPSVIGFKLNWERLIESKGFRLTEDGFLPVGNDECEVNTEGADKVRRHLTALARTSASAPVQLLLRHGLLAADCSFFDYGCGRGNDIAALRDEGIDANGWDPHYAPDNPRRSARVVNLGFVVNVIEDAAERVEALTKAFALTEGVLSVGVMLMSSNDGGGRPFRDGVLTSRNTFQKYFSQDELRGFLEDVLHRTAHLVAPGIAFVFADTELEQKFEASRYRRKNIAERLLLHVPSLRVQRPRMERPLRPRSERRDRAAERLSALRPYLDELWALALNFGRWPDEVEGQVIVASSAGLTPGRARRLIETYYDQGLLARAAIVRGDDIRVFLAAQQFAKRPPFKKLEPRLQRDIKVFFGDYGRARQASMQLLLETANTAKVLGACEQASADGLGWLDGDRSLQVHIDLVERLPALLRTYVDCGLIIWKSLSDVQLVKIHIGSNKLTFLEYASFDDSPLPTLKRRIKINLRRLDYDIFEYGSETYPQPTLLWKCRFLNEESPKYAEQLAFDDALEATGLVNPSIPDIQPIDLKKLLNARRLEVAGYALVRCSSIPNLDEPCGSNYTYRALVQCGETQRKTGLPNVPLRAETYNALCDLAVHILDPVIDYFGSIVLTYGFCSHKLAKAIDGRIAPELDQHAAAECNTRGRAICQRGGAACDFLVVDEDMFEVARWIMANLSYDRLYVYGADRPLHVSFGPENSRAAFEMVVRPTGRRVPKVWNV